MPSRGCGVGRRWFAMGHFRTGPIATPSFDAPCEVCRHTGERTTVTLPDALDAELRHVAEGRGITGSERTREAIEHDLGGRGRRLRAAGAGRGGRDDLPARIEGIFAAAVARESSSSTRVGATPPSMPTTVTTGHHSSRRFTARVRGSFPRS